MSIPAVPERVLTVQVDVDTTRTLLRFYGLAGGGPGPEPVYQQALPRFARLFEEAGVRATFFVVGEDLADEANRDVVRRLHAAGHEIANHSQTHHYEFGRLGRRAKADEIARAGEAIERTTGQAPVGFRAPGYDVDRDVLELLVEYGYRYDSSILPSVLNVPFKLLHRVMSRRGTSTGYGSVALSAAPNRAYRPDRRTIWRPGSDGALWEIPVSCVPGLRLPFYAHFNLFTGDRIFRLSSALAARRDCNYVFHAVEMLDRDEVDPRLHRHPNVRLPLEQKRARCLAFLERLRTGRRCLLSKEFALARERAVGSAGVGQRATTIP
jgi:peptidoglycan-N-acetylglucosamine deacetylase